MDAALSRRSLLQAIAATMATAAMPFGWTEIAQAAATHAHGAAAARAVRSCRFSAPREAADVEAVAAQIIPTDDSPGAREAGVVYFIDRALATFLLAARRRLSRAARRVPGRVSRAASVGRRRSRRSPPSSRSSI